MPVAMTGIVFLHSSKTFACIRKKQYFCNMIQCKLTACDKVITGDFPAAATMRYDDGTVITTYCDNDYLFCRLTERKVGRFMLLEQYARCFADCEFEVKRTGVPVLMLSLAKDCDIVRTNGIDRHWRTGDVYLALTPQEDIVMNHCSAGMTLNLFNFVVSEPIVRQLAERHPELAFFCSDFDLGELKYYTPQGLKASRKLINAFDYVEHCTELGNYAEKFLESKIFDCLSMIINQTNDSDKPLSPVNLVLADKVHDARCIMMEQYANPPSLHELATMVGTNECTLKSAFKQQFGTTVFQFLYDYRMEKAVRYLLDTQLSVAEIGIRLGYDHQSHFCTAFQRKYGMSPSEYRGKGENKTDN